MTSRGVARSRDLLRGLSVSVARELGIPRGLSKAEHRHACDGTGDWQGDRSSSRVTLILESRQLSAFLRMVKQAVKRSGAIAIRESRLRSWGTPARYSGWRRPMAKPV